MLLDLLLNFPCLVLVELLWGVVWICGLMFFYGLYNMESALSVFWFDFWWFCLIVRFLVHLVVLLICCFSGWLVLVIYLMILLFLFCCSCDFVLFTCPLVFGFSGCLWFPGFAAIVAVLYFGGCVACVLLLDVG